MDIDRTAPAELVQGDDHLLQFLDCRCSVCRMVRQRPTGVDESFGKPGRGGSFRLLTETQNGVHAFQLENIEVIGCAWGRPDE
jgi:hypothetical protein